MAVRRQVGERFLLSKHCEIQQVRHRCDKSELTTLRIYQYIQDDAAERHRTTTGACCPVKEEEFNIARIWIAFVPAVTLLLSA
jgi:hypothetical protein